MRIKLLLNRYLGQWPWLLAYAAIALTLVALVGYTWLAEHQARVQRENTMMQDLLWQEQGIRLYLQTNQNALENLAYGLAAGAIRPPDFNVRADALMKASPELVAVEHIDLTGRRMGGLPVYSDRPSRLPALDSQAVREGIDGAATLGYPIYSNIIEGDTPAAMLIVPYFHGTVYQGAVLASYSLPQLLQQRIPWWMVQRYDLALLDGRDGVIAPYDAVEPSGAITRKIAFDPPGHGLSLRASVRVQPTSWSLPALVFAVAVLLALLLWALSQVRRRMRERQAAEVALHDEIRFRAAMEHSLITGLRAMDTEGRLIYVNPAFCKMVGWRSEELLNLVPPFPFWPPEELTRCASVYQAILNGQSPSNGFQLRFMKKDGERFDVRLYASKLVDGRGEHRGWMASLYDVTEVKREREALAASRSQLRAVLEGLEAAVSVTDAHTGQLLYRNRHHATTFVLPVDGEYCLLTLLPGDAQYAECCDPVDGRWYSVQRRSLDWVDGRSVWLDIATDVTEMRLAAEETRIRNERLQHTARLVSMGELASSLAHELNQPLAAIASYAAAGDGLLGAEPPAFSRAREVLTKIGDQARRAGQIIRGIRDFAAKRAPREERCQIDALLAVPLQLLEPLARKAHVRIIVDLPGDLPVFVGDSVMLEQVLFNLLKNGVEAMETMPGKREIRVTAVRDGDALEVSIADRGPGLAEPGNLFQPFYSTKAEGMGIGLNICRSVLEQHKGHLRAEPNPGGGLRFVCRIPLPAKIEKTEKEVY
ncbi:Sensor histidine kinase TmoS [Andreprevotia sp. IGB-42]|uniref:PAS domain-containing sensor histidine kinase n=1 Tax=Andreprevotia sp. IGB-42 TaxID=2497473 RepID=UPI001359407C|nr:PAS domain S-box protein [Andreprevotia sp. IGB-42]KAF0814392.1 Sensor histidine kinase TmoS [Andreprevotia sp. IGB-42]